ncbi:MAG: hypothetical protein KC468_29600, partial [Myxococcales bacterium]|nr:hypothetical protein [Myxococcales bacterium]
MAFLLPLPLPEEAVREHGIVPANDFSHQHLRFVSAGGQHHVVSDLFYNFYRYDSGDNRDYRAFVVTTMDASFSITRVRPLEALTREMTHAPGPDGVERYSFGDEIRCGVTPRGELAFCSRKNRVFVLDAATLERVATYDPLRGGAAGFSDLAPRPGGGLLCSRDRDELLLASAEHALADGVPPLRSIARAYRGARSIAARIEFKPLRPALGELTALADDRVMVPLLADSGRSGWIDDGEFRYVIVDASGEVVGALPLGAADSPYQPKKHPHPECVAHRGLGVW